MFQKIPEQKSYILFHVHTPKSTNRIPVENENTMVDKLAYITPNMFSQVPPPSSSLQVCVPTITQDEDELPVNDGEICAL